MKTISIYTIQRFLVIFVSRTVLLAEINHPILIYDENTNETICYRGTEFSNGAHYSFPYWKEYINEEISFQCQSSSALMTYGESCTLTVYCKSSGVITNVFTKNATYRTPMKKIVYDPLKDFFYYINSDGFGYLSVSDSAELLYNSTSLSDIDIDPINGIIFLAEKDVIRMYAISLLDFMKQIYSIDHTNLFAIKYYRSGENKFLYLWNQRSIWEYNLLDETWDQKAECIGVCNVTFGENTYSMFDKKLKRVTIYKVGTKNSSQTKNFLDINITSETAEFIIQQNPEMNLTCLSSYEQDLKALRFIFTFSEETFNFRARIERLRRKEKECNKFSCMAVLYYRSNDVKISRDFEITTLSETNRSGYLTFVNAEEQDEDVPITDKCSAMISSAAVAHCLHNPIQFPSVILEVNHSSKGESAAFAKFVIPRYTDFVITNNIPGYLIIAFYNAPNNIQNITLSARYRKVSDTDVWKCTTLIHALPMRTEDSTNKQNAEIFYMKVSPSALYNFTLIYTNKSASGNVHILFENNSFPSTEKPRLKITDIDGRNILITMNISCLAYNGHIDVVHKKQKKIHKWLLQKDKNESSDFDTLEWRIQNLIPSNHYELSYFVICQHFEEHQIFDFNVTSDVKIGYITKDSFPDSIKEVYLKDGLLHWFSPLYTGKNFTHQISICFEKMPCDAEDNWIDVCTELNCTFDLREYPSAFAFKLRLVNAIGPGNDTDWIMYSVRGKDNVKNMNPMLYFLLAGFVATLLALIICLRITKFGDSSSKYAFKLLNMPLIDSDLQDIRRCMTDNLLYKWSNTSVMKMCSNLTRIDKDSIVLLKKIGEGAFGEVYEGSLIWYGRIMKVAVKSLQTMSSKSNEADFIKEALIMNNFSHKNILSVYGVCWDVNPKLLILEYMNSEDLLKYLRMKRPKKNQKCQMSYEECILVMLQIVEACKYLEQKKFVHRDIAARNCLVNVTEDVLTVKIGDFGLARTIYASDYYLKNNSAFLPVRWMPPEAIIDGIFSTASDVWSFGVLLWEIMTLGKQPYYGLSNLEVINYVTKGGKLAKPSCSTNSTYSLMTMCWEEIPEKRPSFTQLKQFIENLSNENAEKPTMWYKGLPEGGNSDFLTCTDDSISITYMDDMYCDLYTIEQGENPLPRTH